MLDTIQKFIPSNGHTPIENLDKDIDNQTDNEPDKWIVLGNYMDTWGKIVPVGLPMSDLKVHTSVIGTTGSGKSTLLRNLALQAFMHGASVIVLEPHGDLILDRDEGILAAIPPSKLDRVTVVDLNSAWPPQINMAAAGLNAGRSAAVATAMNCIRVVEDASWTGAVRMREILEHALHLLLAVHGQKAGMLHLQKFLLDDAYRRGIIRSASDLVGESRDHWQRLDESFAERKDGGTEILEVPLRRVGGFLRDERFRRSLSLPLLSNHTSLNMSRLMNKPGQMILVPLQSSELGKDAKRVFGTLFMQLVTNAFMARASQEREHRQQTLVIIDEFADLAGGDVGELVNQLLAEARKFGASVVLATQALHQLPRDVKAEVKSNTNNKIVLNVSSPDDAKEAAVNLAHKDISAQDIMDVAKFHGYARVMVNKAAQPAFYFKALAPLNFSQLAGFGFDSWEVQERPLSGMKFLNELHSLEPELAIHKLVRTDPDTFQKSIQWQAKAGQHAAQQLLADPGLEADPVQRALKISRARYGLPWWFYEAYYRRLRFL